MQTVFFVFSAFVIIYTALINLTYLAYTVMAYGAIRAHQHKRSRERIEQIFTSRLVPPITIILPAYNEEATIVDSVHAMLRQLYSQFELIVVNDGSRDETLAQLVQAFGLEAVDKTYEESIPTSPVRQVYASYAYPRLIVVDKENGGCKADAINAGINASNYPLFCACDADSLLEEDALLQLALPMLDRNGFVPATGGVIRAANGSRVTRGTIEAIQLARRPIEIFQIVEYLRAFLTGRTAQSALNIMLIVSGAFGLFNKSVVKEVGGYNPKAIGEDFELIVRISKHLHRLGRKFEVVFVPQTVCWTMVPHTWSSLSKQRERWHKGLLQTLQWHFGMIFNPRYGRTGSIGMGSFLLIEALGPMVELAGYVILPIAFAVHAIDLPFAALFFVISVFGGVLLSLSALLLEEVSFHRYPRWHEIFTLSLYAIAENFGYRQLTLWWRLRATFSYAVRREATWGTMQREAFASR